MSFALRQPLTRPKSRLRRCPLMERAALTGRVDREKAIIYEVKILGLESANGRRYDRAAAAKAIPLYEGRSVRSNHPKHANESRDVEDVFGWLEGVHVGDDGGLWGNLHVLNPKSDLAESVFNAAEKNPRLFGLSHNAQGDVERIGNEDVVREIFEVRSVDLVADPATTQGLFEGRIVRIKLKEWFSGLPKLHKKNKARLVKLVEDFGAADEEMPEESAIPADDAGPSDHIAALRSGFEGSCGAIIQDALDGKTEPKDALKKLKELLTTHAKMTAKSESGSEPMEEEKPVKEEEEELEECEEPEKKKMDEQKELATLRAEKKGRELCEAAGVQVDGVLLEALASLPSDAARKKLIEREKARAATSLQQRQPAPRSGATSGGTVLTEQQELETPEGALAFLTRR